MNSCGLIFVQQKKFQKNYTFPYCKLGHFPLFYKSAVPGLKIQAINSFFWILVRMIAIHHCAKEQFAWLNGVQMWAPYCTWYKSSSERKCGLRRLEWSTCWRLVGTGAWPGSRRPGHSRKWIDSVFPLPPYSQ